MKKFLFMAATAALVMNSCSNEELMQVEIPSVNDGAISFTTYEVRATRADVNPTSKLATTGFGVFAYEQGTTTHDQYIPSHITPNFMYNQQVKAAITDGAITGWTYTPVKYWPNNNDKVSFFAYAPYDANVNMVWNIANDGPAIEYALDLHNGTDLLTTAPVLNKTKPALTNINDNTVTGDDRSGKIFFNFKHALSKLTFNIQTFVDKATDATHGTPAGDAIDGNTQITVKSLKLNGKFAQSGILRLVDQTWTTRLAETQSIELLSTPIVLANSTEEQAFDDLTDLLLIPLESGQKFTITITYEVKTGTGMNQSIVTNEVTSTASYNLAINTAYEYHLNLGMETVRFNAEVTDWTDSAQTEVALPENN